MFWKKKKRKKRRIRSEAKGVLVGYEHKYTKRDMNTSAAVRERSQKGLKMIGCGHQMSTTRCTFPPVSFRINRYSIISFIEWPKLPPNNSSCSNTVICSSCARVYGSSYYDSTLGVRFRLRLCCFPFLALP